MLNFCPSCGGAIDQNQIAGQALSCNHCGRVMGVATEGPRKVVVDQTEELIKTGTVGRCTQCQQVVQLKTSSGESRTFVPHYAAGQRKMCPGSGKPAPAAPAAAKVPAAATPALPTSSPKASAVPPVAAGPSPFPTVTTPGGRDLSKYYSREMIRVVACSRGQDPSIEELSLQYLDKKDRVRIQFEALREILGPSFRMKDYPAALGKPHLALWSHATGCVVACKHPQGGYQPTADDELIQIVNDLRQNPQLFFE